MSLPQPKLDRREEIYQAAKRLVECGENPQPGLSDGWPESMERLYQSLVRLCKDDWT